MELAPWHGLWQPLTPSENLASDYKLVTNQAAHSWWNMRSVHSPVTVETIVQTVFYVVSSLSSHADRNTRCDQTCFWRSSELPSNLNHDDRLHEYQNRGLTFSNSHHQWNLLSRNSALRMKMDDLELKKVIRHDEQNNAKLMMNNRSCTAWGHIHGLGQGRNKAEWLAWSS